MTNKQTLELALDALKVEYRMYEATDPETGAPYNIIQAIKALEEALAKQEQGEPVAWMDKENHDVIVSAKDWDNIDPLWYWMYRPLYTTPQPKQEQGEPFGWYDMEHGEIRDVEWNRLKPTYEGVWRPLYTTPQQRTWVELTKGEIESWELPTSPTVAEFAWFIESKVKEKNL